MAEPIVRTNVGARLDRLPVAPFHRRLFALVAIGMFFDGFDIYIAGSVLGATLRSGFSDLVQNGLFISVTFIGMMSGAFLTGFIGDRFGRRITFQLNLAVFGLAALAAAAAPNMTVLIALRFVMGLGLGAEAVVGYSVISEFVPSNVRGRWAGYIATIVTSGLPVSALLAYLLVPAFGWRVMFVIGGVGALVVWALRQGLPESPRWLEAVGRIEEADALVSQIEADVAKTAILPPPSVTLKAPSHLALSALFRAPLLSRMIVGCVSLIVINMLIYGFITWLPTFLVRQGFSIASTFGYVMFMTLGGPLGSFIGAFSADAIGRKPSIIGAAVCAAVFALLFTFVTDPIAITIVGFLLTIPIYVLVTLLFGIYIPEIFPTEVRLRATGICNTVGRAASIVTPLAVVPLVITYGIDGVLALMIAALVVMASVVALLGIEPERRALEDMAPATPDVVAGSVSG
jgi:putative MFS transporter